MSDVAPPWVLFIDRDRPVAILPAGRPGEVANVKHLSMVRAQEIVRLANALHLEITKAKIEGLDAGLRELAEHLGADVHPPIDTDALFAGTDELFAGEKNGS